MREILFRGKRVDNDEWVEGDLRQDKDLEDCFINGWEYYMEYYGLEREPYEYEVKPETVGQYIGLTDKNGRKIFEGDILIVKHSDRKGNDYVSQYAIRDITDYIMLCELDAAHTIEVIGNIHDDKRK